MIDDETEHLIHDRLSAGMMRLSLDPLPARLQLLTAYIRLLTRWNRAYNLTAVRDPLEMVSRHLLDSMTVAGFLSAGDLLDLGSGAGLPGIPLAILRPEHRVILLDSNGKKTRFMRQAAIELGLNNIEVVQSRIETYRPEQKFATIISRAVTTAAELCAATRHLRAHPSRLLLMKGRDPDRELTAPLADVHELSIHSLSVPLLDGERHLVEIRFI